MEERRWKREGEREKEEERRPGSPVAECVCEELGLSHLG